jgi:hypothetical protein
MASIITLYANRYELNITENFHHRFILLPWNKPAGKYSYYVWIEKRKSWLSDDIFWCSRLVDANNKDAHRNEISVTSNYERYSGRHSFLAELVNYAQKYDYWEENRLFNSKDFDFKLSNYNIGDKLEYSNFEVEVYFDNISFDNCLETFKSFGIDIARYNEYYKYKWKVSRTSAKLYYDKECIYTHPNPMYVLAMLGWYIAPQAM